MTHSHVSAALIALALTAGVAPAQDHVHHDGHDHGAKEKTEAPVAPPRVFLDKSPRVVRYQLRRLSNERLLLVERQTTHAKYALVYEAILARAGMASNHREEALAALVKLRDSNATRELLAALEGVDMDDPGERRTGRQLAELLLRQPLKARASHGEDLRGALDAGAGFARQVAFAALIASGDAGSSWEAAQAGEAATIDWLAAVRLVPDPKLRSALREKLVEAVKTGGSTAVRREAIAALASVPANQDETFRLLAPLVKDDALRAVAVRTLLAVPVAARDAGTSRALVESLVALAESTPAAERTTGKFLDAMQLADQTLARIPIEAAREYRARLREITVRVVRIKTVEEEMRYDTPYFAVEAGRPVQVVLENGDLMPHNLVITVPGALQEVAELGLAAGPEGHGGKQYVPNSEKVLHATNMVQPARHERLTFTAPAEPGEYPYVCTFPRHWMRMYGVMVVVEDLDAWLQDPKPPEDPIGSNRSFVKAWTLDDFPEDLAASMRGRSPEIGFRIFEEATCGLCHKMAGVGGAVGPELTDVLTRWKGDRRAVLREILEPAFRVDPKYAVRVIVTRQGKVVTGVVTSEDRSSISVLENPESPTATEIKRSHVVNMVKTSTSLMPKALLDRFTQDEIFELLAYLESGGK